MLCQRQQYPRRILISTKVPHLLTAGFAGLAGLLPVANEQGKKTATMMNVQETASSLISSICESGMLDYEHLMAVMKLTCGCRH